MARKKYFWCYNSHTKTWIKYKIINLPHGGRRSVFIKHSKRRGR